MRTLKRNLHPFGSSIQSESLCFRPDNERQLKELFASHGSKKFLSRGSGLSYSDSSLSTNSHIIDTRRLNHFIRFDNNSGFVECQAAVTIKELFDLHPQFIPPVFPGTAFATVGGAIAHDVHGKNNAQEGSFGHHIHWIDVLISDKVIRCSREKHTDLFYATIAGLGLTGFIKRVGLQLKKASDCVQVKRLIFTSLHDLFAYMVDKGISYDYQVAWVDLLHPSNPSILSLANHLPSKNCPQNTTWYLPKLPFCVLNKWTMSWANYFILKHCKSEEVISFQQFNNPLDRVRQWNRLYGPGGLIQFQAVFDGQDALHIIGQLVGLIQFYQATPILSVLKFFTQQGQGFLSFCKPGFTLAIDFYCNDAARQAILAMNQYICDIGGRVYLAKDLLVTPEQLHVMYEQLPAFKNVLAEYKCRMSSDLSRRVGIVE